MQLVWPMGELAGRGALPARGLANLVRAEELMVWPLGPYETRRCQGGPWNFRSYNTILGLLLEKAPVSRWLGVGVGGGLGERAFRLEGLKIKALRWDWIRR